MRIPLSKVYRAFPELDRFSDAECERFVLQVSRQRLGTRYLIGVAPVIGLVVSIIVLVVVMVYGQPSLKWLSDVLNRLADFVQPDREADIGHLALFFAALMWVITSTYLSALLARDWHLRRGIRLRLEVTNCTACRQSLLGLPLLAGERGEPAAVRCPECGTRLVLQEIGLTPRDIIARSETGGEAGGSPVGVD